MDYYYLVAALPTLSLESESAPITMDEFVERCRDHLTGADRKGLEQILLRPNEGRTHPFVRRWQEKDAQLRNAVARSRAGRLGVDPSEHVREEAEYSPEAERAASEAFSSTDPVEREKALDRFRWSEIDALAGFNPFAGRAVLAYGLKLALVERWMAMNEREGEQRAEEIAHARPGPEGTPQP